MKELQFQYVIDIGTCVGIFTDHCLAEYPISTIYAFEPLRANYEHLQTKYRNEPRVQLFHQAVSNFNGTAPLYKKRYIHKHWGIPHPVYDFAGNEGSSLNRTKSNVSQRYSETVAVISFRDFMQTVTQPTIDLLKIDSEGTEYDILHDILDAGLYKRIQRIYFEDHTRKIPALEPARQRFLARVQRLGISHQFYLQRDYLTYVPLTI